MTNSKDNGFVYTLANNVEIMSVRKKLKLYLYLYFGNYIQYGFRLNGPLVLTLISYVISSMNILFCHFVFLNSNSHSCFTWNLKLVGLKMIEKCYLNQKMSELWENFNTLYTKKCTVMCNKSNCLMLILKFPNIQICCSHFFLKYVQICTLQNIHMVNLLEGPLWLKMVFIFCIFFLSSPALVLLL